MFQPMSAPLLLILNTSICPHFPSKTPAFDNDLTKTPFLSKEIVKLLMKMVSKKVCSL